MLNTIPEVNDSQESILLEKLNILLAGSAQYRVKLSYTYRDLEGYTAYGNVEPTDFPLTVEGFEAAKVYATKLCIDNTKRDESWYAEIVAVVPEVEELWSFSGNDYWIEQNRIKAAHEAWKSTIKGLPR